MREYRMPLKKRMQASARFRRRYRQDPQFRLNRINERRAAVGKPLMTADELPPVGKGLSQVAASRKRDDKGRWI